MGGAREGWNIGRGACVRAQGATRVAVKRGARCTKRKERVDRCLRSERVSKNSIICCLRRRCVGVSKSSLVVSASSPPQHAADDTHRGTTKSLALITTAGFKSRAWLYEWETRGWEEDLMKNAPGFAVAQRTTRQGPGCAAPLVVACLLLTKVTMTLLISKSGTPLLPPMQSATTFISLPGGEEVVTIPAIGGFGGISTQVIYSDSVKELSRGVATMPFS